MKFVIDVDDKGGVAKIKRFGDELSKADKRAGRLSDTANNKLTPANKKLENSYASVGAAINAAFGAVAVQKIASFASFAVSAADKQIKADIKLENVLRSTGNQIGYTLNELKTMASEMQGKTLFGDDTIEEAQAIALTFTRIGKQIFPEMLSIGADMASFLGQGMKETFIQLGKAINDPIKGLSALSRVGVSFSLEQQNQIKNFIKQNDIISAQKIMLNELKTEFGGAAQAAANAGSGGLTQFMNVLGDTVEILGMKVLPSLDFWVDGLGRLNAEWAEFLGSTSESNSVQSQYGKILDEQKIKMSNLQQIKDRLLKFDNSSSKKQLSNVQDQIDSLQKLIDTNEGVLLRDAKLQRKLAKDKADAEKNAPKKDYTSLLGESYIAKQKAALDKAAQLQRDFYNGLLSEEAKALGAIDQRADEYLKAGANAVSVEKWVESQKDSLREQYAQKEIKRLTDLSNKKTQDILKEIEAIEEAEKTRQEFYKLLLSDEARALSAIDQRANAYADAGANAVLLERWAESEKDKIRNQYAEKDLERQRRVSQEKMDMYRTTISEISSISSQMSSLLQEFTNQELAEINRKHEDQVKAIDDSYKREIAASGGSAAARVNIENRYNKKKEALDKKKEAEEDKARKRTFESNKNLNTLSAIMNTAEAVTRALAIPGGGPYLAALYAVMGGAEVALIRSQKLATGGESVGKNALVMMNENGQEAVLNNRAYGSVGRDFVTRANHGATTAELSQLLGQSGGGSTNVYVTIGGLVTDQRTIDEHLVPAIERSVRRRVA